MRLVLCDDQQILGDALAAALAAKGHDVLAVTTTAAAGVAAVAAHRPDVCVLDVLFPEEQDGLYGARTICQHHPSTRVLLISGTCDPRLLAEAAQLGVAGFVSKAKDVDEIAAALDVVAAGGVVFDLGTVRAAGRPRSQGSGHPLDALSPREREILARIVAGNSTQLMAGAMGITTGTVRMYVRGVLTKLGAHSRLQVAAMAHRHGWLGLLASDGAFAFADRGNHAAG
jgi:DNA-binding NarL/FixJ family response regulator